MQMLIELNDYQLHDWIMHNVSEDPDTIKRTLESAVGIYYQRVSQMAIESRALMRVELTNHELSHRLKHWWDNNTEEIPYSLLSDWCYGYTTVLDVRHLGGKTFSILLG